MHALYGFINLPQIFQTRRGLAAADATSSSSSSPWALHHFRLAPLLESSLNRLFSFLLYGCWDTLKTVLTRPWTGFILDLRPLTLAPSGSFYIGHIMVPLVDLTGSSRVPAVALFETMCQSRPPAAPFVSPEVK